MEKNQNKNCIKNFAFLLIITIEIDIINIFILNAIKCLPILIK